MRPPASVPDRFGPQQVFDLLCRVARLLEDVERVPTWLEEQPVPGGSRRGRPSQSRRREREIAQTGPRFRRGLVLGLVRTATCLVDFERSENRNAAGVGAEKQGSPLVARFRQEAAGEEGGEVRPGIAVELVLCLGLPFLTEVRRECGNKDPSASTRIVSGRLVERSQEKGGRRPQKTCRKSA